MPNANDKLKNKVYGLPKRPGIYQFLNDQGKILYVGKAKNLRSRVRQYFGHDDNRPQIPFLMAEATDINYTVVNSELESAYLENTLIKQYSPKYNIDLKDDKNYAFIKIDYSTQIPQIGYARKIETRSEYNKSHPNAPKGVNSDNSDAIRRLGSRYFGPYSAAYKIRNTLHLVRKIFTFCSNLKVSERPCFYFHMHRCPGVCVGKMSLPDYQKHLEKIAKFLQGDTTGVQKEIKAEMLKAATAKKFETAARLRDQLKSLMLLSEKQNVILPKNVDWDIISPFAENGFVGINLFKIRGGKMFDKENFVYELASPVLTEGELKEVVQRFCEQYYQETSFVPKTIYVSNPLNNPGLIKQIIKSRFSRNVKIISPQKGQVKKLLSLGQTNAEEYLKNWLNDKAGNLDKINQALNQLQQTLKLPAVPRRIECYDISNIQGTNAVGSMVVFVDGLPAKAQYRKFKIRGKTTPDDFAMMTEMLTRRFARLKKADTKFPKPDLIVIDGGKGQLNAALSALQTTPYKLQPIPIIGLAKRIEEIFLPNQNQPIILNHDQPALQLLQRLRDEAHRFGITFHRSLRSKQAVHSALDDIPGIGPKTKKLLKTEVGTVEKIRNSSFETLSEIVGNKLAKIIKQSL